MNQLAKIITDFCSKMEQTNADWSAERDNIVRNIDKGEEIVNRICEDLLAFRKDLTECPGVIREAIKNLDGFFAKLEQLRQYRGISFWNAGRAVIVDLIEEAC